MNSEISAYQIIQEIALIPEDKLTELYNLIHGFRVQLTQVETSESQTMQFAGIWEDLPEDDFLIEIETRRHTSNTRRFSDESLFT
jgi:hypothetical protein